MQFSIVKKKKKKEVDMWNGRGGILEEKAKIDRLMVYMT